VFLTDCTELREFVVVTLAVMEAKDSGIDMLKSYFNRKVGDLNVMVCRLCKKEVKVAKGMYYRYALK
jgi:hypothetical protein